MGVSATCFRDLETFFKKLKISIFDPISNYFFVILSGKRFYQGKGRILEFGFGTVIPTIWSLLVLN